MNIPEGYEFQSMTISPVKGHFDDAWWDAVKSRVVVECNEDNGCVVIMSKEKGQSDTFSHIQCSILLKSDRVRKFRDNIKTICRALPGCDMSTGRGHRNRTYRFVDRTDQPHMFGYPLKEIPDLDNIDSALVYMHNVDMPLDELVDAVDLSMKGKKRKADSTERFNEIVLGYYRYRYETETTYRSVVLDKNEMLLKLAEVCYDNGRLSDFQYFKRYIDVYAAIAPRLRKIHELIGRNPDKEAELIEDIFGARVYEIPQK